MAVLLGAVRPRWPHPTLGRSRHAGLDIVGRTLSGRLPPVRATGRRIPADRCPGADQPLMPPSIANVVEVIMALASEAR